MYTLFSGKDANFRTLIHSYTIIILLFVQQKCKHGKVAFLTFRSVSKHVLFALGVDPTARDEGEIVQRAAPQKLQVRLAQRTDIHT